uniref:Uncharacterized protein n=1 Tax=Pinguiococcus pyrenoidosus TaxID=172671 RepID=A0A7R9Y884_9STRA
MQMSRKLLDQHGMHVTVHIRGVQSAFAALVVFRKVESVLPRSFCHHFARQSGQALSVRSSASRQKAQAASEWVQLPIQRVFFVLDPHRAPSHCSRRQKDHSVPTAQADAERPLIHDASGLFHRVQSASLSETAHSAHARCQESAEQHETLCERHSRYCGRSA